MKHTHSIALIGFLTALSLLISIGVSAQSFPTRYPMLELFTNTPCPICANQNPGLFNRLASYEGEYHLVSFYPGKPYASCIFYQANIPENTARWQFYTGDVFGTPTVAINGVDFKSSNGVTNMVLDDITGGTSWLEVEVDESTGTSRTAYITLEDHAGGSLTTGLLFAVIVEREIMYNAPNGETLHHNVFRKFLTATGGDEVDLSSGTAMMTYEYEVDSEWQEDEVYVVAWVMDPSTEEILNSGTRFDPDFTTAVNNADAENIQIYPNPSKDHFTILLPGLLQYGSLYVYNSAGALIFSQEYNASSQIKIDGSSWPEGNYVVRLRSGEKEYVDVLSIIK